MREAQKHRKSRNYKLRKLVKLEALQIMPHGESPSDSSSHIEDQKVRKHAVLQGSPCNPLQKDAKKQICSNDESLSHQVFQSSFCLVKSDRRLRNWLCLPQEFRKHVLDPSHTEQQQLYLLRKAEEKALKLARKNRRLSNEHAKGEQRKTWRVGVGKNGGFLFKDDFDDYFDAALSASAVAPRHAASASPMFAKNLGGHDLSSNSCRNSACKVCRAVKEAEHIFKQNLRSQATQEEAVTLSSRYRTLESTLLEQQNAFDTFRARFLARHAFSIKSDLNAIGRHVSLALASVSHEQIRRLLAVWDEHYRIPGQVLTAAISVDPEDEEPIQVHITNLAGLLVKSCRFTMEAPLWELESKVKEVRPVLAAVGFLSDDGKHVKSTDLLKCYASLIASSVDYDVDLIVDHAKPKLYSLSVNHSLRGAQVTDVRSAQFEASYTPHSRSAEQLDCIPLLVAELKPLQYVLKKEKRESVRLRIDRDLDRQALESHIRNPFWWFQRNDIKALHRFTFSKKRSVMKTNWRQFACKAWRSWNPRVLSVRD